jgi:hypothetical protein
VQKEADAMAVALTELEQATPAWLTAVLQRNGCLDQGHVLDARQEQVDASSLVAHLALTYTSDAPAGAPRYLLLKMTDRRLESFMPHRNQREIAFYGAVARGVRGLPVVRCYDAVYERGDPDRFHLLLDDPSMSTHDAFEYSPMPPTMPQCEMIIDVLAQVHAACWDTWSWAEGFRALHTAELHTGRVTKGFSGWVEETMPRFLESLGDRASGERHALYRAIGASLPARLLERQAHGKNLTLTQGDVHIGNFLYPRDAASDNVYVIDWKRADVALGASDLAYMIALQWFPELRAQREHALLTRYYHRLLDHGVAGYTQADLWDDYRLSVMKQLFEPIWGWSIGHGGFWSLLEPITLAIQDLGCVELL